MEVGTKACPRELLFWFMIDASSRYLNSSSYSSTRKLVKWSLKETWNCKPLGDGLHFSNTEVQFHVHLSSSRPYFSDFKRLIWVWMACGSHTTHNAAIALLTSYGQAWKWVSGNDGLLSWTCILWAKKLYISCILYSVWKLYYPVSCSKHLILNGCENQKNVCYVPQARAQLPPKC